MFLEPVHMRVALAPFGDGTDISLPGLRSGNAYLLTDGKFLLDRRLCRKLQELDLPFNILEIERAARISFRQRFRCSSNASCVGVGSRFRSRSSVSICSHMAASRRVNNNSTLLILLHFLHEGTRVSALRCTPMLRLLPVPT